MLYFSNFLNLLYNCKYIMCSTYIVNIKLVQAFGIEIQLKLKMIRNDLVIILSLGLLLFLIICIIIGILFVKQD